MPSHFILPKHGQIVESLRLRALPLFRVNDCTPSLIRVNVFVDILIMHLKAKYPNLYQENDFGILRWSSLNRFLFSNVHLWKKRMP